MTDKSRISARPHLTPSNLPVFPPRKPQQDKNLSMNLQRSKLETTRENLLARFIDLLVPLAKGQSGLIVGPHYAGARLILEAIASSVAVNHPEVAVVMLLLDQHEDEAAAVRRSLRSGVFSRPLREPRPITFT
jgi:transcription termination factor Rho